MSEDKQFTMAEFDQGGLKTYKAHHPDFPNENEHLPQGERDDYRIAWYNAFVEKQRAEITKWKIEPK